MKVQARPQSVKPARKSRRPPSTRTTPEAIRAKVDDPDVQAYVDGRITAALADERRKFANAVGLVGHTLHYVHALARALSDLTDRVPGPRTFGQVHALVTMLCNETTSTEETVDELAALVRS